MYTRETQRCSIFSLACSLRADVYITHFLANLKIRHRCLIFQPQIALSIHCVFDSDMIRIYFVQYTLDWTISRFWSNWIFIDTNRLDSIKKITPALLRRPFEIGVTRLNLANATTDADLIWYEVYDRHNVRARPPYFYTTERNFFGILSEGYYTTCNTLRSLNTGKIASVNFGARSF